MLEITLGMSSHLCTSLSHNLCSVLQLIRNIRSETSKLQPSQVQKLNTYMQSSYDTWAREIASLRNAPSQVFREYEPRLYLITYGEDQPMPLDSETGLIR